jgi:tight adherence protein B
MVGALPVGMLTAGDLLSAIAIALLLFFAAVFGLAAHDAKRVRKRIAAHLPVEEGQPKRFQDMRAALATVYEKTDQAFGRFRAWRSLGPLLERSGVQLLPAQIFYLMLGSGLLLAFLVGLAGAPAVVLLLVVFPFGASLPYLFLRIKGSRRQKAFDELLPQLLMTISASVRAGHSFRASMQSLATEAQEPARLEFSRVLRETDYGRPIEEALDEMAKRLESPNLDYVVRAVSIQREVGGNLAGLFGMVAETVRQRQRFTGRVRALTAQGRISAIILTVMPFLAMGLLTLMNPKYTAPLFTTSTGRILLLLGLTGILVGGIVLKRMVSFRTS